MRIEIVSIGDELLSGRIINSNAAWLCSILRELSFKVARQTTLPDETAALKSGLKEVLARSDLVITTGGLGPTCDDLTREVAADLFHSDFYDNPELLIELQKRYGKAVASLEDQARVPKKAIILENLVGTAPGLLFSEGGKTLVLLPGVPAEMRAIVTAAVIPYLKKYFPIKTERLTQELRFSLLTESQIDPFLRKYQKQFPELAIGIYPAYGTVSVSLSSESKVAIKAAAEELKTTFSDYFYEAPSVEEALHIALIQKKLTLATAESCTGGEIAAMLTKIPGASNYFLGSIVAYSNALKEKVLQVSPTTLEKHGSVSKETVTEMLLGLFAATDANWGIAVSGILGPSGGTPEKPVGTVWAAIGKRGERPDVAKIPVFGSRAVMIESASRKVLAHLLRKLVHNQPLC